jgi:hypothetical protein
MRHALGMFIWLVIICYLINEFANEIWSTP